MIRNLIFCFALLIGAFSQAQLPGFTLMVTTTNETCFGNGKINAQVSGIQPGATVNYSIYKLPDTTTPVATGQGTPPPDYPFEFLFSSGDYLVIATQSLNGQASEEQINVTILDHINGISSATTDITHTILCGDDGEITVDVNQGNAQGYKLCRVLPDNSCEEVYPQQSSNKFSNLTPGEYLVGVYDAVCDQFVNITYHIPASSIPDVHFLGSQLETNFGSDCNASKVSACHLMDVPRVAFPIDVIFTVHPPGGAPDVEVIETVDESIIPPGSTEYVQIIVCANLPYYQGQYTYDVTVTNGCGDAFKYDLNDQVISFQLEVDARLSPSICHGIDITVSNYQGGGFTIVFDEFPTTMAQYMPPGTVSNPGDPTLPYFDVVSGGTPGSFPGPFDPGSDPVTFGIIPRPGPNKMLPSDMTGHYKITVTDECGVEGVFEFDITNPIQDPVVAISALPPMPFAPPIYNDPIGTLDLDCIPRGIAFVQHQLYLEQEGSKAMGVAIVDGPADFKTFLTDYLNLPALDINDPTTYVDLSEYIEFPPPEASKAVATYLGTMGPLSFPFPYPVDYDVPLIGAGLYTFRVTDICGNWWDITRELFPFNGEIPSFIMDTSPGCGDFSSVNISPILDETSGAMTSAKVLEAPQEFWDSFENLEIYEVAPGEYDLIPFAYLVPGVNGAPGQWFLTISGLPPGDYKFDMKVSCLSDIFEFNVPAYFQTTNVVLQPGCSVFNFEFIHDSNHTNSIVPPEYILEWLNPSTNGWETIPSVPQFNPGEMVYNVNRQGEFRIRKIYYSFYNDPLQGQSSLGIQPCEETIYEFEFYGEAEIKEITTISCAQGGGSEAIVEAVGSEPLTYFVFDETTNQWINNGTNPAFQNLAPGMYTFRVEDNCGSFQTGQRQVGDPISFNITESNLCQGAQGSLSVNPPLSFIDYEWYKVENGTDTLVGTGNQLIFAPFDVDTTPGTYKVKIIFLSNPTSCANQELTYEVGVTLPNAGNDEEVVFCHEDQIINLFDLHLPPYDTGGTWEDTDGTGALTGSEVNTQGVPFGTYRFKYVVGTDCSGGDEAFVEITLAEAPGLPVINPVDVVCEGQDVQITIQGANTNYTYLWTGPDGTTTYTGSEITISGATISNGMGDYKVIATLGNCTSPEAEASVTINPTPNFSILGAEICEGGKTTDLFVTNPNYAEVDATYVWFFEGNEITGENNPILNVDTIGNYTVTVTVNGCEFTQNVEVVQSTDLPAIVLNSGCNAERNYSIGIVNTTDFEGMIIEWIANGNPVASDTTSITLTGTTGLPTTGTYQVIITDTEGCSTTTSIDVGGIDCMIPKGVTPNDDGRNDAFDLSNFNVNKLKIFNRYGMEVYDAPSGYTNEWHGQTNDDKLLPSATYYYVVTFGDGTQRSGWVYLNREE